MTFPERAKAEAKKYAECPERALYFYPGGGGPPEVGAEPIAEQDFLAGAEWAAREVRDGEVTPLKEALRWIEIESRDGSRRNFAGVINDVSKKALEAQAAREREGE